MKIELDTRDPLSDLDLRILALLLPPAQEPAARARVAPPAQGQTAPEPDPEPESKPEKAPEKAPEKEPERVFEDEMNRVIAKATDLVSQGKSSEIRKALAKIGIERVSAIESLEQLDAFEQALGPWL